MAKIEGFGLIAEPVMIRQDLGDNLARICSLSVLHRKGQGKRIVAPLFTICYETNANFYRKAYIIIA